MGIMITYHGYNNPMYNTYKNVGVYHTWQSMVIKLGISNIRKLV